MGLVKQGEAMGAKQQRNTVKRSQDKQRVVVQSAQHHSRSAKPYTRQTEMNLWFSLPKKK